MRKKIINKITKQAVLAFILGAFIFGTIGVGATTLLYSKDVVYDNSNSGLNATTIQDALDELYETATKKQLSDVLTVSGENMNVTTYGFTLSSLDTTIPLEVSLYYNNSDSNDISTATLKGIENITSANTSVSLDSICANELHVYFFAVIKDTSNKYEGIVKTNTINTIGTVPEKCTAGIID